MTKFALTPLMTGCVFLATSGCSSVMSHTGGDTGYYSGARADVNMIKSDDTSWAMTPLLMKQIFSPAEVPAHFKAGFQSDMALRPSQLRATAADTAMMPLEAAKLAPRLAEIATPALILTGDGDKIVSFKHQSRRLARELAGGQIQVIEGAGHMLHHTAPDEVAAEIATFLTEIGETDLPPLADALTAKEPILA